MKKAFTLAEVLITLGIIGIVAALTIPTLIQNYRLKVLKTRYLQTYAILSEAVIKTRIELGENLLKNCYRNGAKYYPFSEKFQETFLKNCNYLEKTAKDYTITNYNNTKSYSTAEYRITPSVDYPNPLYLLKNGSSVNVTITSGEIKIFTDINGPSSGPNQLGYDIFMFLVENDLLALGKMYKKYTSEEDLEDVRYPYIAGLPCTKDSPQILNGIGCSWYATNDKNPDDETQKYWDSLKL